MNAERVKIAHIFESPSRKNSATAVHICRVSTVRIPSKYWSSVEPLEEIVAIMLELAVREGRCEVASGYSHGSLR